MSGVETTSGPLGQGVATSVGMAIAEKWLAHRYNRPGFEIFDYHVYAVCGDGCMMEGSRLGSGVAGGPPGLDNLCWIYDNNHITIEGNTNITFTEDVATRFLGYGWNVLRVGDANDIDRIEHALEMFQQHEGPPDPHHPGQPHRLRLSEQAGHRRSARRAARRRRDPRHQAQLRMARGRQVSGAGWRARALHGRDRRTRRGSPRAWEQALRGLPGPVPRARDRDRSDAAARASRGMGQEPPRLPGRPERRGRPRGLGQDSERPGAEHSVAHGWLGGSRAVEQDPADLRRRRAFPGGHARTGRICTTASASTRWRRSSTGSRCPRSGPSGRPSSSSATTRGRPSGCPR